MRHTLEEVKKDKSLINGHVLIFSGQHGLYLAEGGSGYTHELCMAGLFTIDRALEISAHSGPEKEIEYCIVNKEDFLRLVEAGKRYAELRNKMCSSWCVRGKVTVSDK